MKVVIILSLFFFPTLCTAQYKYKPIINAEGSKLYLNNLSLGLQHSKYYGSTNTFFGIGGDLRFIYFKLSEKILTASEYSYGADYQYQEFKSEGNYTKNSDARTSLSANTNISYYLLPRKFYVTASIYSLADFMSSSSPNYFLEVSSGIGYGRIYSVVSSNTAYNFASELKSENINLNPEQYQELSKIIERRRQREYLLNYTDFAERKFFKDIENYLLKIGAIKGKLSASAVLKLLRTITNNRYIYYTALSGFQAQIEASYENNYIEKVRPISLLSTSFAYGFIMNPKTSLLLTGYVAVPLRKGEPGQDLFPGLYSYNTLNMTPLIIESYALKNAAEQTTYSLREIYYRPDTYNFIAKARIQFFRSLSPFIGLRIFGEATSYNSKFTYYDEEVNSTLIQTGITLDYNILSKLYLSASGSFGFNTNNDYPHISFNTSLNYIIF